MRVVGKHSRSTIWQKCLLDASWQALSSSCTSIFFCSSITNIKYNFNIEWTKIFLGNNSTRAKVSNGNFISELSQINSFRKKRGKILSLRMTKNWYCYEIIISIYTFGCLKRKFIKIFLAVTFRLSLNIGKKCCC